MQGRDVPPAGRGEFGYCQHRGCINNDAFDLAFVELQEVSRPDAVGFVREHDLRPFVRIPVDVVSRLCGARTLVEALPTNIRGVSRYRDLPPAEPAAQSITTAATLEMGWPLILDDVLGVENHALRSRALAAVGKERLVREAGVEEVHADGPDRLLRVRDMMFVQVTDTSTPRTHLLRVPPRMTTVRQAVAWTFGFDDPDDYPPLRQT